MDVADIVAADLDAALPYRLEKRQRFDVADSAADLDNGNFRVRGPAAICCLISSVIWGITCTVPPR